MTNAEQTKAQRLKVATNIEAVKEGIITRNQFVDAGVTMIDLYGSDDYLEALLDNVCGVAEAPEGEVEVYGDEVDDDGIQEGAVKNI